MEIRFREVDPFNCWIWMRFSHPLGHGERGYVETVFDSWFFLGKLGGFNAETLPLHEEAADLSWLVVDQEEAEKALPALMHNMGPLELQGEWARCWVDMGTSDVFALDVLLNALRQLNKDVVEIEEVVVGGINEDWPIEEQPDSLFPQVEEE